MLYTLNNYDMTYCMGLGVLVGTGSVLAGIGWVASCIYTDTVIPKLRWFGAARDSEIATLLFLFLFIVIRFRFGF
ncbi:hypothetical protein F383_15369 [Gossypium arboreum]|uniref:Uncharacterized protein n=1 Tax=Gossypium arboreum TaxID=29729 RepID=A0A0B0M643_GOSAR|nr:hypothetical protein F383_15369 [Gossypium arboreum]